MKQKKKIEGPEFLIPFACNTLLRTENALRTTVRNNLKKLSPTNKRENWRNKISRLKATNFVKISTLDIVPEDICVDGVAAFSNEWVPAYSFVDDLKIIALAPPTLESLSTGTAYPIQSQHLLSLIQRGKANKGVIRGRWEIIRKGQIRRWTDIPEYHYFVTWIEAVK